MEEKSLSRRVAKKPKSATQKPPDFVVKLYAMFEVKKLKVFRESLSGGAVVDHVGRRENINPGTLRRTTGKTFSNFLKFLSQTALTKYFRTGKFTSFQRQLNNVSPFSQKIFFKRRVVVTLFFLCFF